MGQTMVTRQSLLLPPSPPPPPPPTERGGGGGGLPSHQGLHHSVSIGTHKCVEPKYHNKVVDPEVYLQGVGKLLPEYMEKLGK